ncbi:hypothetical protein AcW1_004221 [Taiwanofungus camphoratus]|nr:hypothetical protein AcW2_006765 [Antrodia cinnamomea]KAI0959382.1 hypothetical protein AcW1_004221 [Antrodia cinnamomea]
MNKNPFVTTAAYNPQQPPLPPGPPPPQPAQPDYSAYWAAATAAQHVQAPTVGTYNPQWSASQPAQPAAPRPTPEQSALYANYGYGGQQNLSWQQQQRQTQPQFQPPPPVVQPPPPPPQPAYNPYQPQAGAYQQPYVPQGGPTPQQVPQTPYQQQVTPQPFQQQQQPFFHPQQQGRLNNRSHNVHHTSPQHLPPAKRQRFDGPNQHRGPAPPQPQFQPPPPPPPMQQGGGMGMFGQGQNHGRGGGPGMNHMSMGGGRGGFGGGRGGNNAGGRGRGTSLGMNRGGNRGRGGSYNNMGGRGGGVGQGGGSFRGHGSNRGFGNRDNRRGGSFGGGGQGYSHGFQHQQQQQHHHHQQNYSNSFRGRNQGFSHSSRGGRHDSGAVHTGRDNSSVVSAGFSAGKKDENRRTLTDFKIVGLEIQELAWSWGKSFSDAAEPSVKMESSENTVPLDAIIDTHNTDETGSTSVKAETVANTVDAVSIVPVQGATDIPAPVEGAHIKAETTTLLPPPPSRIRIYFHTPVTADDAQPIASQSYSIGSSSASNMRKGKRKKLEDDDGDLEDGRGPPPPPPQSSGIATEHDGASMDGTETAAGRDSVAPSVAETASEGDWLMAAIGGDEGEGEEGNSMHVSDVDQFHDADAEGEYEGNAFDDMQGDGHDEYHLGDDDVHGSIDRQHDENASGAEQDNASSAFHAHNGVNGTEHHSLNGASDVASEATPDHWGNGLGTGPDGKAAFEVGSENLQHAGHPVSADPSVSHDVSPSMVSSSKSPAVSVPPTDHANDSRNGDAQAEAVHRVAPLQAASSIASTVPDTNLQNPNQSSFASTVIEEHGAEPEGEEPPQMEATQPAENLSQYEQHFRETSVSPASNTVVSGTTYTGSTAFSDPSASQSNAKLGRIASANRLSVSYAAGMRRMVIDAEIVDKLKVLRGEGRVEVYMNVEKDEFGAFKGIMMEGYSEATSSYAPLDMLDNSSADSTVPAFSKVSLPSKMLLVGHLDRERPLSEPRWVKTGDVQEWLKSMFGRMFWVAGDAAGGWEKKIEVVDPDPAPTIWTVLEAWAQNSSVGLPVERQRFLRTHMTETDNILEILLRLVRGERSTYNQTSPAISAPSVSGPLLSALSPGAAHGAQQTHVSLAVLAIFRLAVEYAKKAAPDAGKGEAEERVGEIIRSLPSHLLYKSLDGIFKEWKVEKKGGR